MVCRRQHTTTLPSGTVTFLFTDIEGSTRLWELNPQAMSFALERHDATLSSIISEHGGTVVKSRGEGDSFFAVFPKAADALAAATQIQLALQSESWPTETPIQVRMALHTGEVQLRNEDYYGRTVNRCARLRAIAHGGQVVVSGATAELAWDTLPEGVGLKELGSHRLRDLSRPEVVYQVQHPALRGEFPPLKSREVSGHESGHESEFVGRGREMEELRRAVAGALAGRGQLAMLVGEPGIGKTRTAEELAEVAREQGARVLWGRCYEGQGAPPYWPWVQVISSYVQDTDTQQLRTDMGPGAPHIAEIVSEISQKLDYLAPPSPLEPTQARFRLFSSVTTFLKNISTSRPLMLVLDDLHWADPSSLLLLEFLAQEVEASPLLVLGTYRDAEVSRRHPLSQTLGSLIRQQRFLRVQLPGLAQPDVEKLIQAAAGVTLSPGLVETIHQRTEGNPLFVNEVIRTLPEDGFEEGRDFITNIPEGVRDAIGRRLSRLSEECNQVLTLASVIGRECDFRLLDSLSDDIDEDRLQQLIDEALDSHLMEEIPGSSERYRFSHALVQETLSEELSTRRKVRLHARIGEALEKLYGADVEDYAGELAHHFAQAGPFLGVEKLVRYSLLAGQRALRARAYEEAEAHIQRGLTAKGVTLTDGEPVKDAEDAALLSCLGQAQIGTQSGFGGISALATLTRAFDYYVRVGDVSPAVRIAAHHIPINTGIELIEQALELVPPDSHDAGRLLSRCITPLRSEYDSAQKAVHNALEIARQRQDLELEMHALVSSACVDYSHCLFGQSLDHYLQVIQLARRVDQTFDESHARFDLSHVFAALGDLEEAARHAEAMLEVATRSGNRQWQTFAMETHQNLSRLRGDWHAVRDFTERGLMLTPTDHNILACMALVEHEVGDFDAGRTYLDQLLSLQLGQSAVQLEFPVVGAWTAPVIVIPLIARITGVPDHFDRLESTARSIISSPSTYPGAAQGARIGLAFLSVQRGDKEASRESYGALMPIRGTAFPQSPVGPGVAVDRLLGLLSQTVGNMDQASAHFEDAMAFCRRAGYPPELAWTCCDYAEMLLERDGLGDRDKATALLDESLAISSELSMRPLMERVRSRR